MRTPQLRAAFLLALMFFLTSCFDVTEEFTIKENGSGSYNMKMDMYKMIEMISEMGGSEDLQKDKDFNRNEDTTVYFKNNLNKSEDFSKEEIALLQQSSARMKMSLSEKQFFMSYNFPFSSNTDIGKIYQLTPKAIQQMKLKPEDSENETSKFNAEGNDVAKTNGYFEVKSGKNFFEKKLLKDEWIKKTEADSSLEQLKPFMAKAYMISVVHTPRPVTKCEHPLAQLSEDKKTVTIRFSYTDYFERPELLSYRIEY